MAAVKKMIINDESMKLMKIARDKAGLGISYQPEHGGWSFASIVILRK